MRPRDLLEGLELRGVMEELAGRLEEAFGVAAGQGKDTVDGNSPA